MPENLPHGNVEKAPANKMRSSLWPALRPMQNADDLNCVFVDPIDREKRQTVHDQLPRAVLLSWPPNMRKLRQRTHPFVQAKCHLPGGFRATMRLNIVANCGEARADASVQRTRISQDTVGQSACRYPRDQ